MVAEYVCVAWAENLLFGLFQELSNLVSFLVALQPLFQILGVIVVVVVVVVVVVIIIIICLGLIILTISTHHITSSVI